MTFNAIYLTSSRWKSSPELVLSWCGHPWSRTSLHVPRCSKMYWAQKHKGHGAGQQIFLGALQVWGYTEKSRFPGSLSWRDLKNPSKCTVLWPDKARLSAVSKKRSPTPQMHTEAVFWEADQYAGEFRTDLLFNTTAEDIPPDSLISPKLWNTEDYSIPSTGWCNVPDTPGTQEESGSPTSS